MECSWKYSYCTPHLTVNEQRCAALCKRKVSVEEASHRCIMTSHDSPVFGENKSPPVYQFKLYLHSYIFHKTHSEATQPVCVLYHIH
ncbi:hypothetical protein E2C01_099256 [Portunus trituberculatus]|uniref:Uncharacterized protein n=1 Tax=Portunus trituberculatus TaxID=210409 RepID=A0A5B7KAD1_PORTR|nr:hypothetical protein [Portunus trituberculatus]